MTPVIEVTGLTARTGTHRLVDGVDLTVPSGTVTALVGPSGSGKTTTALALLGEAEPGVQLGGRVRVADRTVVDEDGVTAEAEQVRGGTVAYMPQHPGSALNPARRTGAVLTELARLHQAEPGASRAQRRAAATGQATEALRQAQLPAERGTLRRFAHQFSGGQRQRIGIARALALRPKVIVCDEPVSALDVSIQAQVMNLLGELQQEFGLSYIFIAHDLGVVRHLSDRVGVMYLGQMVEVGTEEQIYEHPQHPYTQALLSSVPVPDPQLRGKREVIRLSGDVPSPADPPSGCRFRTRCWKAQDICAEQAPELKVRLGEHPAACHFAEERPEVLA